MNTIQTLAIAFSCALIASCNSNNSQPGQNTTDAGTQQSTGSVNSDMESVRTASDVDTVTSPGSNSQDIKGVESNTGTTEPNTTTGTSPSTTAPTK